MTTVTLLGTGSPMPSPGRAGPATHFDGVIEIGGDLHRIEMTTTQTESSSR